MIGRQVILPPYRGQVHPDFDHPEILQALKHCHDLLGDSSARILLDSRNRVGVVSLPLPDGNSVDAVIKEFRIQGVDLLKSLILPTKAFKAWRGATALVERAIGTPLPIAFLEPEGRPLRLSYFLSREEKSVEEIRHLLRRRDPKKLEVLLGELARHLAICHKRGILHRDLSDGNMLVKDTGSGSFRFFMIDTNRIRVKKRIGRFQGIKNLIRLGVPSELQRSFLKAYLEQSDLHRPLWWWYRWNKSLYTSTVRLKKALKLRKLVKKLKIQ